MTHTAEPMTLAQVSDSLRKRAKAIRDSEDYVEGITDRMADWFDVRADAIDAELAKQRDATEIFSVSREQLRDLIDDVWQHATEGEGGYPSTDTRDKLIDACLVSQQMKHCEYCDGTGDVHRADGEWLGECTACSNSPQQRNAVDARSESDDAEEIAQWLHTRGHHKAAQTIRTQLDVRNARIRELEQRNAVKVTDENMVQAVAWAIAEADGCEPEQLIWEGNPPEPWGIVANKYEKHARAALSAVASRDREDAERFDFIERECLDLRCVEYDDDFYFVVVEHHMGEPRERVIGTGAFPRQAIDAARRENKP
jgi:hypothetical protein